MKQQKIKMGQKATDNNTKMVFAQSSKGAGTKLDRDLSHITCFHCGSKVLYTKDCQKRENCMHTKILGDEDTSSVEQLMTVYCNKGSIMTNQKGMFRKLRVWYNPDGIAKVISPKMMSAHYEVMYSSKDNRGMFIVHTSNGKMEFKCHPRGLHYLDLSKLVNAEIVMAMTLQEKFEGYTKRQIEDAKKTTSGYVG